MPAPLERSRRPGLDQILGAPMTQQAFLSAVRARMIGALQRDRRAPRVRAGFIRERLPELAAQTIADADRALAGMLVLPGTGARPYFVGDPPEWFANPVNDNEYLWLLNRHGHWRSLLAAFSLTDDTRYAEKVIQELRDWIARCQRPPLLVDPDRSRPIYRGISPWRTLETGIRMFESWPLVLEHLADTDLLTLDLLREYAISLYEHAEVLADVAPGLFPRANHNVHIMQNLGLLTIAALLPELDRAAAWREQAISDLERAARVQITDGGGQIEGCPHYHNVCLHYLSRAQLILASAAADAHGDAARRLSSEYENLIRRALDYSVHAFRPSGTGVPWGDSDADRRAVTAALYGGLAFGRWEPMHQLIALAGRQATLDECLKSAWRIPDLEGWLDRFERLAEGPTTSRPTVSWQRTLGQVAMRTDWSQDALSVFFACHTPISDSGHAHIDPMGFDFTALGRPLVVDPGRYCYRQDDDRRTFKTAAYHNTLMIDRTDPYPFLASGRNGRPKYGDVVRVQQSDRLLAVEAVHHNYAPASHRRVLAIVDGTFVLVLDQVQNIGPEHSVQIYFHLDSPNVAWDPEKRFAHTDNPDVNVLIAVAPNVRGELLDGRVSDYLDQARPSRRLCLEDAAPPTETCRAYATVIVPFRAWSPTPAISDVTIDHADGRLTCRFALEDRRYAFTWDESGLSASN